jgi:hypothetical protein
MKAVIPARRSVVPAAVDVLHEATGVAQRLLAPLLSLADNSDWLVAGSVGEFAAGGKLFQIPRFIFMGPRGGGDTVRLGLFATIHGDEPQGAEAMIAFLQELERCPQLALGYHIYAYPICNPTGLEAATHLNAKGKDLACHFWQGSDQPEAYYLEREIGVHRFAAVISLHSRNNETTGHFRGLTGNVVVDTALVQPALEAANNIIQPGRQIEAGLDREACKSRDVGFLTATQDLSFVPIEINFEIPSMAPRDAQIRGTVGALKVILDSYRTLLATQANI